MAKVKIEVEVSKEGYEAGVGLGKFAMAVKKAVADGWQTGEDLPPILTAAVTDLAPALIGVELIPAEFEEDAIATINGITEGLNPFIASLIKKSE